MIVLHSLYLGTDLLALLSSNPFMTRQQEKERLKCFYIYISKEFLEMLFLEIFRIPLSQMYQFPDIGLFMFISMKIILLWHKLNSDM
jgi:hypothetical protein